MMRLLSLFLLLTVLPSTASAFGGGRFTLGFPVACVPGESCFIRSYVSHGEEESPVDYTCGALTAKRHKGTDIAVEHEAVLTREGGVPVLAAADGVAKLVQSKEPTAENPFLRLLQMYTAQGACGTGLEIEHINGWRTYYCHLAPDSLKVTDGEKVRAGQVIAAMGMSGNTNFPHLHFEVWHHHNIVDPFAGVQGFYNCGEPRRHVVWNQEAFRVLPYHPAGFVGGGFTAGGADGGEPLVEEAQRGHHRETHLPATSPMLYLWSEIYGLKEGDVLRQEILAPDGKLLAERTETYEVDGSRAMQAVTVPRPENGGWGAGRYTGRATLTREGVRPIHAEWATEIQ